MMGLTGLSTVNKERENLTVTKANALNEAGFKLSLSEGRLLLMCLGLLDSQRGVPDEITIRADDYAKAFDLDYRNAHGQLRKAAINLYKREVRMKGKITYRRWLDGRGDCSKAGEVTVSFANWVKPYLGELKSHFTSYRLDQAGKLNSGNSFRLFDLICQYKNTGYRTISLKDFRRWFDIKEGQYKRYSELRRKVIEPGIKDINTEIPYVNLGYRAIKKGRRIERLVFTFSV